MARTLNKTAAQREKAQRALDLRLQGATYDQVAKAVGYSDRSGAFNAVKKLQETHAAEGVEQLRAQGQARYEAVIRQATVILQETEKVTQMNEDGVRTVSVPRHPTKDRIAAARTIIRAQDSINRLFGLNMEVPDVDARTQTIIVEAETLSNNQARALLGPDAVQVETGDVIDVVVDEE